MRRSFLLLGLACAWLTVAGASAREEQLMLGEGRAVTIKVPDGFAYKAGLNRLGELGLTLVDATERATLTVTFAPDPEGTFAQARAQKEKMHEEFKEYVAGSVEQAMQFEELEPRVGSGTYCLFTDAKLVGKTELPPNEFRHLVVGVKAWPGVVATFTLFSQDPKGEPHLALVKTLRESVHEKPAPLL